MIFFNCTYLIQSIGSQLQYNFNLSNSEPQIKSASDPDRALRKHRFDIELYFVEIYIHNLVEHYFDDKRK